jgi:hypothetical protein
VNSSQCPAVRPTFSNVDKSEAGAQKIFVAGYKHFQSHYFQWKIKVIYEYKVLQLTQCTPRQFFSLLHNALLDRTFGNLQSDTMHPISDQCWHTLVIRDMTCAHCVLRLVCLPETCNICYQYGQY